MKSLFYLTVAALSLIIKLSYAQGTVNGSFELSSAKSISRGWTVLSKSSAYHIQLDSGSARSGKYVLKVQAESTAKPSYALVYNGYGLSSAKAIATIEVSGWIKITHAADSALGIFIRSLSGRQIFSAFAKTDSSQYNQWQKITVRYQVDIKQPWSGFHYGITLNMPAMACVDDITIKVDGKLITDPKSLFFEPSAGNIKWLNNHLSALKSVSVQPSHKDMTAIGQFCSGARLVGIGEPTHGTHEALQFKLRLLDYLVTEKGFNTIALEEVIPTCDKMNDLLNANPGAVKDSLLKMPFYKLWKSAEMNELFAWISRYNHTHSRKVNLIGFDMEDTRIRSSRKMIREIGLKQDEAIAKQVEIIDQKLDSLIAANSPKTEPTLIQTLADDLKAELVKLSLMVNKQNGKIDPEQFFRLQTYTRVCLQWLDTRFYNQSPYTRDRYLADNVKFYTDHHPEAKVLIWAHNAHIANLTNGGAKAMGAWLKHYYGKAYLPIAFTSAAGSYTAAEDNTQKVWKAYPFETAYRGTYSYILGKAKSKLYFLPLNTVAVKQKGASWLHMPMTQLDIPYVQSGEDEDYRDYGMMTTAFDGVVFCKTTTAAQSYLKQ